uniref:DNA double-strand break repair protein Mre11 n=1 Tax=Methanococcus maripaludis (strain C6 / ATCC BAA-1332) TaxID=444158 RepID=A9A9X3_METM6
MQFVHMADNHLGYRQYSLDERENDIYESFLECIDKIIEIKPDFVIHSGDLFESPQPPVNAIRCAMEGLLKLKEKNIPIYLIHGNHDIPKSQQKGKPFGLLKKILGNSLLTFGKNKSHVFNNDVFIGGIEYVSQNKIPKTYEDLEKINSDSKDYRKKILLFHQSVNPFIPQSFEMQVTDFPEDFNYIAGGHIHQRALKPINDGNSVFSYSGSTDIMSVSEVKDYKKNGKGFYLGDLSGDFDINSIQKIDVECRNFLIDKKIKNENDYEKTIKELQSLQNEKKKPVLYCDIVENLFNSFNDEIAELTLYKRISRIDENLEGSFNINESSIDEIFQEYIKNKEMDVNFVYGLYKKLLENDCDSLLYVNDYFKGNY